VENRMDVKYITGNISGKNTKNSHNLLALTLDECQQRCYNIIRNRRKKEPRVHDSSQTSPVSKYNLKKER